MFLLLVVVWVSETARQNHHCRRQVVPGYKQLPTCQLAPGSRVTRVMNHQSWSGHEMSPPLSLPTLSLQKTWCWWRVKINILQPEPEPAEYVEKCDGRRPAARDEVGTGVSVRRCQVFTADTRHVTRLWRLRPTVSQSHSQCLDWLLILKLSLMMNSFTDDIEFWHLCVAAFSPGQVSAECFLTDLMSPSQAPLDLTSCTLLTLRVSSVQRWPGCTLVPTLSATSSLHQPIGGEH